MTTGFIGRRLLRCVAVLALAGLTVGCASSQQGATVAPPGFGKDPVSRAERLVSYCDRLADKGELVTALGLCARAQEINPGEPEILMKIATLLYQLDRKQAAAQTYEALLDQHPRHHEARYSLGKLYMETGESSLAALHLNQVVRNQPQDPRAYNALGIIRDQEGEHEAAQALYRTGLEFEPQNHALRNNLGLSLALSGQREAAIDVLAALAVDPEVDRTVLHNLEAAYAARALPAAEQDEPSEEMEPMPAGATTPPPAATTEPKARPVKTEVRDVPSVPMDQSKPKPAPRTSAPMAPAEPGAPTPLYVPKPSTAGEPQQTGGRQPAAERPSSTSSSSATSPSSVILAAAEELMAQPEWADFEPGALIEAEAGG